MCVFNLLLEATCGGRSTNFLIYYSKSQQEAGRAGNYIGRVSYEFGLKAGVLDNLTIFV